MNGYKYCEKCKCHTWHVEELCGRCGSDREPVGRG